MFDESIKRMTFERLAKLGLELWDDGLRGVELATEMAKMIPSDLWDGCVEECRFFVVLVYVDLLKDETRENLGLYLTEKEAALRAALGVVIEALAKSAGALPVDGE